MPGMDQINFKELPFFTEGIAQIGMLVQNLEHTVEMFWKLSGIGPWHFYTYAFPLVKKMTYYGEPADYKMRVGLANWGTTRIELIEPLEGRSIYADFIAEHGYGFHHVGILVVDMESALQNAEAAGLRVIQDGSGFGLDGDGYYAYLDTERQLGVIIELIQRPKRRSPPEKIYPMDIPNK
jgi:hypothetical protein